MVTGNSEFSAALIDTVDHESVTHVPGQTVRCAKTGGYLMEDLLTAITICMDRGKHRYTCVTAMPRTAPLVPTVQRIPQPKRSRDDSVSTVDSLRSVQSSDGPPDQAHSHQSKKGRCELPIHQDSSPRAAHGWHPSVSPEEQAHWQYFQWLRQWQMFYHTQACGPHHTGIVAASASEHVQPTYSHSIHSLSHSYKSYILHPSTHNHHTHHPCTHHHNRYLSNNNRAVYPHEVNTDSYGRLDQTSSSGASENSSSSATTEEESVSVSSAASTDHVRTYPSADGVDYSSAESANDDSFTVHTSTDFDINELFNVDLWDF
eukprot:gene20764-23583_t